MNNLKCEDCGYFWKEECEDRPRCHWTGGNGPDSVYGTPWDIAPCEEEPYLAEDDDDFFASENEYATMDDYYGGSLAEAF